MQMRFQYGLSSTVFVYVSFQDEGHQGWLSGMIDMFLPSLVRCIWHRLNNRSIKTQLRICLVELGALERLEY